MLNDGLLREVGLDALPDDSKRRVLAYVARELQTRTIRRVVDWLPEERQLAVRFLAENVSERAALESVSRCVPETQEIMVSEFAAIKAELTRDAPAIISIEIYVSDCDAAAAFGSSKDVPDADDENTARTRRGRPLDRQADCDNRGPADSDHVVGGEPFDLDDPEDGEDEPDERPWDDPDWIPD